MRQLLAVVGLAFAATASSAQGTHGASYQPPRALSDGWTIGNADSLGVDSKRLAALTQSVRTWPELGVRRKRRSRTTHERSCSSPLASPSSSG